MDEEQIKAFKRATNYHFDSQTMPVDPEGSMWHAPPATVAPAGGGPSSVPWCNNMPTVGMRQNCERDKPLEDDILGNAIAGGLVTGGLGAAGHGVPGFLVEMYVEATKAVVEAQAHERHEEAEKPRGPQPASPPPVDDHPGRLYCE